MGACWCDGVCGDVYRYGYVMMCIGIVMCCCDDVYRYGDVCVGMLL